MSLDIPSNDRPSLGGIRAYIGSDLLLHTFRKADRPVVILDATLDALDRIVASCATPAFAAPTPVDATEVLIASTAFAAMFAVKQSTATLGAVHGSAQVVLVTIRPVASDGMGG